MEFNLADILESVVDVVPDREMVVAGDARRTYRQLDDRANRLAHHLADQGVGAGDHVGIYAHNCVEFVEAMYGCWKIGAVPINVNYRYVENELRYLIGNADLVGLVYQKRFAPLVARLAPDFGELTTLLQVHDASGEDPGQVAGSVAYEDAVGAAAPDRDFGPRSGDARYVLYTGGTTGMPKGVVWRHEDIFLAALAAMLPPLSSADQVADHVGDPRGVMSIAPLIHGGAQWTILNYFHVGQRVVIWTEPTFDADPILRLAAQEAVEGLAIIGDGMGRPIADALHSHDYGLSLDMIGSGGAMLSKPVKEQLRAALPGAFVIDSFGASETGHQGMVNDLDGPAAGPRFTMNDETTVLDDDLVPVEPGSGTVGRLARSGHIPLGYYQDPEKTAETFPTIDGRRWVLPGDSATVDADGTITVLGRGSQCINSGGEKIFPEEVEDVLRSHPAVFDALVCGVPDERFQERVVALVQPRDGIVPTLAELQDHVRAQLAGYKVPRELILGPVQRTNVGKPDYVWARAHACDLLGIDPG